jgi:hypothetical protein
VSKARSEERQRRVIEERWAEDFIGDPPWFDIPDYPPKPTRVRKPNIKALVKEVQRAGLTVRAVVIEDGSTRLEIGQPAAAPEATALTPLQEWRAKHAR